MNYFINNIHINSLFHLKDLDILIDKMDSPHLIITGKNGSGKTVLLNAMSRLIERKRINISEDVLVHIIEYLNNTISQPETLENEIENASKEINSQEIRDGVHSLYGKVDITFNDLQDIVKKYANGDFIFAFYQADRKPKMLEPSSPTKPEYEKHIPIKETVSSQFLNFLSNLKIQGALAKNEKNKKDAENINSWFRDFEKLLKDIFQDDKLKLDFSYRNYSFKIHSEGKVFKFTEVSDGFAAVLEIVADLILKMQGDNSLTRNYEKEGIVLIDEIETHLHLELQKLIMPLLTSVFPNIQFIVTTHSPFVLSSMDNAIAYDLEHQEVLEDLTDYSYEALAEGYFGVKSPSSYAEMQLRKFKRLLEKERLSDADKVRIKQYKEDFDKIPEAISPQLVGGYRKILIAYSDRIEDLSENN